MNQVLNVEASKFLVSSASIAARLASVRVADALARVSDDSVPHLAEAYPDQAASTATTARSSASTMVTQRSWPPSSPPCSADRCRCSAISLPTSLGDKPPSPIGGGYAAEECHGGTRPTRQTSQGDERTADARPAAVRADHHARAAADRR